MTYASVVGMRFKFHFINIFNASWLLQKILRRLLTIIFSLNKSISIREIKGIEELLVSQTQEVVRINNKSKISNFRSIFRLYNACVNPKTGVVWSNNRLVEESTVWSVSDLFRWEPKPILTRKINGKFINLPDNGFYHFVVEDLPRFLEVFYSNRDCTILLGSKANYLIEALKILNETNFKFYNSPVNCSEYLFSEKVLGGLFSVSDKERILAYSDLVPIEKRIDKIFISRKANTFGSFARGIELKAEIEYLFESKGFVIFYFEDLTLAEQISLIKGVKVLAGFHGAGLANLVWSKKPIQIIEITETRKTNHFKFLSEIYGDEYCRYSASQIVKLDNLEFE